MNNKNYIHGVILSLINCFSLGILGVIDKIGTLRSSDPLTFSTQSLLFSLLFSFIFNLFYFKGKLLNQVKALSFSSWKLIILVGIFASGIFILLRFLGLRESTGTFATLSQIVTTSITALLAGVFLKERLSKSFWLLFVLIIISIYFVSVGSLDLASVKLGDFFILLGTVFLAAANIFSKIVVQKISPILLSLGRFLFGFIFLLVASFVLVNPSEFFNSFSGLVIISGLLWTTSVITFNLAIQRIGVTFTASLLMLAPVITMILEYFLLGYQFTFVQIIAALVVMISGIVIIFTSNTPRLK